ncbi:MAG: hypothetical protein ABI672_00255 [Vicinamibacteria bacterium]
MDIVLLSWMHRDFRRRQAEDQPSVADVYIGQPQNVAKKVSIGVWFLAVDEE